MCNLEDIEMLRRSYHVLVYRLGHDAKTVEDREAFTVSILLIKAEIKRMGKTLEVSK